MKKITLLLSLLVVSCFVSTVWAMGGTPPSPSEEVEIIENIAAQTEEAATQEEYEMQPLVEIPWGMKAGELGIAGIEGMIIEPKRLVVDGNNNLYILDPVNNRINKYNSAGKFIREYPADGLDSKFSTDQNGAPKLTIKDVDIGVDNNGNLYIFNKEKSEIRRINQQGIVLEKQAVLPATKAIKVENNGKVKTYDDSGEMLKTFDEFETPGGLNIKIGALSDRYAQEIRVYDNSGKLKKTLQQNPAKASKVSVYDDKGALIKEIDIQSSLALWSIRYLGLDDYNNIYLYLNRGTGQMAKWQVNPNTYWETEVTGDYVRVYRINGAMLNEIKLVVPKEAGLTTSPSYYRGLVVNKNGDILLLVRYGDPLFVKQGSFKIIKWGRIEQ